MNADISFGEADLRTCDRESIHTPGSIQPHGVLLVVDRHELTIEQVAGDTRRMVGVNAAGLIGTWLSTIFDADTVAFVTSALASTSTRLAPLLRLGVAARRTTVPLDLTLSADGRTVLIELEPARPVATNLGDPIAQLKRLLSALAETSTVEQCCAAATLTLRKATGFDRAMVYRFDADESGVVIAEDLEPGLEPFLGLHYPASDIPQQARELYKRNWLRAIPDVHYVPADLQPACNTRTGGPIDMSNCDLRSVSPLHLEYLSNMGVGASLVMSVICNSKLWGMLVLHHGKPIEVPAHVRVACETFAQVFSLQIEAKTLTDQSLRRIDTRRIREAVVARLSFATDIGAELVSRELLRYVNATGMAVRIAGTLRTYGFVPGDVELTELIEWLDTNDQSLFVTDELTAIYPAAAAYSDTVSGMMSVALTRTSRDHVLWFRAEYETTVRWAGDPSKPIIVSGQDHHVSPRRSFAEWRQMKQFHSTPWSEVDQEAAEALRVTLLESVLVAADKTLQERDRAIQRQTLLLAELDHRVRNALAKIESLVTKSSATETSVRSFATGLRHRIAAMAQTHTLLSEGKWVGTSLRTLIESDVAPAGHRQRERITLTGEDMLLSPLEALALSVVLYELMTNAQKHGALSTQHGTLALEWRVDAPAAVICIDWRESGRPAGSINAPGSGIELIERTLKEELGGSANLVFAADGLHCELRLPLRDTALR